jgi:hypothetical protein
MITPAEIETYAERIAAPGFEMALIEPLIGHLSDAEFKAVMDRASGGTRTNGCERTANASLPSVVIILTIRARHSSGSSTTPKHGPKGRGPNSFGSGSMTYGIGIASIF